MTINEEVSNQPEEVFTQFQYMNGVVEVNN